METETLIITVGGSLIVPDEIDVSFLRELKEIVLFTTQALQKRVVLSIGGGKTARRYQEAGRQFPYLNHTDLDWLGIKSIHLNADLVWRIFSDQEILHPQVLEKVDDYYEAGKHIIVVSAHDPGYSSDTDALFFAELFDAKRIINFSNIDAVYDADPREDPDAKPLNRITWDAYLQLIPQEWTPGLSAPFDPVASRMAKEQGRTVVVLGASLENLKHYLSGEAFQGTIIQG